MRIIDKLKQKIIPVIAGLCLVAAALFFEISGDPNVATVRERLNSIIYDLRMRVSVAAHSKAAHQKKSDVVIVDVDEKSLSTEGRWPWTRDKVSNLLQKLREGGAAVIAFDVVFAESEKNIADSLITELNNEGVTTPEMAKNIKLYEQHVDHDQEFADKIKEKPDVVMGYILSGDPENNTGALPPPLLSLTKQEADEIMLNDLPGQIANIPILQVSAVHGGFVTTLTDSDGVIRRLPLVLEHHAGIYPSLGLAAVMQYYFLDSVNLNFISTQNGRALTNIIIGNQSIPTDAHGQVLVPYQGYSKTIPYISATEVLNGKIDPKLIDNKIVFVGASAIGLGDLHTTPFESSYPGVEVHATVAQALLTTAFAAVPDWSLGAIVFILFMIGTFLSVTLPYVSFWWVIVLPFLLSFTVAGTSFWLYDHYYIYLSSITIYLMMFSIAIMNAIYGFLFESRKRMQLKEMFGQYVPPAHVERMSESKTQYSFEGESRDMSVLFADIRNFTHISESLDPSQLKHLLNDYFTPMTKVIFDHGGTIDKYVGDMIMAFWGAPMDNPNHALDAVKAGFEMQATAASMRDHFQSMGVEEIKIGVGINSGFMNVGDMGSKYRRSYTVLGDTVNLASRLESSTKFYHTNFIISQNTLLGCHGEVTARHLDRVKVIGKDQAIEIYEPICLSKDASPELLKELETLSEAEKLYYAADWEGALKLYHQLHQEHPEIGLYELFIERISELKAKGTTAPWDGCYVRVTK